MWAWEGLCRTPLDFQGVKGVRIGKEFSSAKAGWVQPAAQRLPSMGEALGWSPNMAIFFFPLELRARKRWWKEGSKASCSCAAALRSLIPSERRRWFIRHLCPSGPPFRPLASVWPVYQEEGSISLQTGGLCSAGLTSARAPQAHRYILGG